jgi:hypothetical protein
VIRHNGLTEWDLTVTHGWTFPRETSLFPGITRGCVNVRVFFREKEKHPNRGYGQECARLSG